MPLSFQATSLTMLANDSCNTSIQLSDEIGFKGENITCFLVFGCMPFVCHQLDQGVQILMDTLIIFASLKNLPEGIN